MSARVPSTGLGRKLQPYFTFACIHTRESSGQSRARIADLAGISDVSIKRFEEGKTYPTDNFERYAAAYAYDAGIDPRDLIRMALDWWKKHGSPPLTAKQEAENGQPPEKTFSEILEAVRYAAEHGITISPEDQQQASRRPTARRRKKAAGE